MERADRSEGGAKRRPATAAIGRRPAMLATLASFALLGGCASNPHAPSVSLFGSFFPVWLMAAGLGVVGAVALRLAFIRIGVDDHLPAPMLVYLLAAIQISIVVWALWSGEALLVR